MLMFISYEIVERFFADNFLLLLISSWNFHDMCPPFLCNQKRNFNWIRHIMRNVPINPIVNIAHFGNVMSIDMTLLKWANFSIWVYREILCLFRFQLKFRFWQRIKTLTRIIKFQFEKTSNKKVIAKKRLTYKINSSM